MRQRRTGASGWRGPLAGEVKPKRGTGNDIAFPVSSRAPQGARSPRRAPLVLGDMEGLQWRRVRPGGDLERPTLPITWIVIIDDRGPGAAGPSSFDAGTLQWLFADAFQIAIDAAEPKMELYEWFVEEGLKGKRILIIHTL